MKWILSPLAFLIAAQPALAELPDGVAKIEVLPGWETPQGTRMAGLKITLAEGWKTYWRAPGDAGIPPTFSWDGSQNIAGAAFYWPTPEVFSSNGMQTIGYHDQVVLPVEFTPDADGGPMTVAGSVEMGVCDDICMPVTMRFNVELPPSGKRDALIASALVDQPVTAADAAVSAVTCAVEPIRDGLRVTATIAMPSVGGEEVVVIESGHPDVWVSEAVSHRDGGALMAVADVVPTSVGGFALDRSALRLTVLGSDLAVDIKGCTGS